MEHLLIELLPTTLASASLIVLFFAAMAVLPKHS
jgi:hypothetical protein